MLINVDSGGGDKVVVWKSVMLDIKYPLLNLRDGGVHGDDSYGVDKLCLSIMQF